MALLKESDPINFIGTRVLVRSNNEGPCLEGILVEWEFWGTTKTPIVKDKEGKKWICFGVLLPYNPHLQKLFDSLPYREAYELASDISILNQARFRRE